MVPDVKIFLLFEFANEIHHFVVVVKNQRAIDVQKTRVALVCNEANQSGSKFERQLQFGIFFRKLLGLQKFKTARGRIEYLGRCSDYAESICEVTLAIEPKGVFVGRVQGDENIGRMHPTL